MVCQQTMRSKLCAHSGVPTVVVLQDSPHPSVVLMQHAKCSKQMEHMQVTNSVHISNVVVPSPVLGAHAAAESVLRRLQRLQHWLGHLLLVLGALWEQKVNRIRNRAGRA